MIALAERLPVGLVPKQRGIAFMRDDGLNFCGGNQMSVLPEFDAARIPGK
jgi:hypothetical protein